MYAEINSRHQACQTMSERLEFCFVGSNHVKSGPFKICSTKTAHRIKLCSLKHLFRMKRTTTYLNINQIRRKTFFHKIDARTFDLKKGIKAASNLSGNYSIQT